MPRIKGLITGGQSISDKNRPNIIAIYHVERKDMTYASKFIPYYTKDTSLGFNFPIDISFEEFKNPNTNKLEAINVKKD